MGYNGTIELIAGVKPANNGNFPMVNAKDVYVDDDTRLDAKLNGLDDSIDDLNAAVVTDATLSQTGKPADAKAVGDAINNITIEVDATLSQTGKAADAKATGDAVADLKTQLNDANNALNDLGAFTKKSYAREQNGRLDVLTGHGLGLNISKIPFEIPANKDFIITLNFDEGIFASNKIAAMYVLYSDGTNEAVKYDAKSGIAYTYNKAKNIDFISFYQQASNILDNGTLSVYVSVYYSQDNSIEEQIENIESDIERLSEEISENTLLTANWENGKIDNQGQNVDDVYSRRTEGYIPTNGHIIRATNSNGQNNIYLAEYDTNKTFLEINAHYGVGSIESTNNNCAFTRVYCYSTILPQDTLDTYVSIEAINNVSIKAILNEHESQIASKMEKEDLFAFDLIEDVDVIKRIELFEIGASLNNDGNSTYIYKYIISNETVTGAIGIKCDEILGTLYSTPIVVRFYDSSNTQISEIDITVEKAKKGQLLVPPDNATTFSINLYPSTTGGLVDTTAKYYNIRITVSEYYNNYFDDIGKKEYRIPYYYLQNDYITNKVKTVLSYMEDADANYDAFIFCTDQHWPLNRQQSPALFKFISNRLNINRAFMGGDCDNGINLDALNAFKDAYKGKIYNVTGNHEYMNYFTEDGIVAAQTVTGSTVWQYLDGDLIDAVVGVPQRNYYYIDNPVQKMRYIILNVYEDNGASAVAQFDSTQQNWFENEALNLPNGYTAVIFAHFLYGVDYNTGAITKPAITETIESIVDGYSGNGEIACLISGHTHIDGMTATPGGIPAFITTCDKYMPWIEGTTNREPWLTENRIPYTITEQAFDVVVVDKTSKKVVFVRIGAPADNGTGTKLQVREQSYDLT